MLLAFGSVIASIGIVLCVCPLSRGMVCPCRVLASIAYVAYHIASLISSELFSEVKADWWS